MRLFAAVLIVAALCPSRKAAADEHYYALFFAFQNGRAEESHTFIEFIRAELQPGGPPVVMQRDTISWLPSTGVVRLYAIRPETGRNYSLPDTLMMAEGKELFAWGPYEMTPHAYQLALAQIARLHSGEVRYRATDITPGFNRHVANCIHAAAEIDPNSPRIGQYNVKYGARATRQVIRAYVDRGFLCDPCLPHDEIYLQLGLENWPIDRRNDWQPAGVARFVPRLRRR